MYILYYIYIILYHIYILYLSGRPGPGRRFWTIAPVAAAKPGCCVPLWPHMGGSLPGMWL